jgi:hypothetical protein
MCKQESLQFDEKIFHCDKMIQEAARALELGMVNMDDKWVREFVERGKSWESILQDTLSE